MEPPEPTSLISLHEFQAAMRTLPHPIAIRPMIHALLIGLAVLASFDLAPVIGADTELTLDPRHVEEQIRPFLTKHCLACHGSEKPKGKLQIHQLSGDLSNQAHREQWLAVAEQLNAGAMPPEDRPRPPANEVRAISDWLVGRVTAAENAIRTRTGRTVLRRLNRFEYENTINDLLEIKASLRTQLPQDGSANGFDNAGAAHHTSSFLMEKYLEAADVALSMAVANRPKQPVRFDRRVKMKESHPIRSSTEKVYRFLDDETVVCFCSSAWHNVSLSNFYPQDGGFYRFRISTSAFQSAGKPVTFRVLSGNARLTGKDGLVGYFDALPDEPRVIEFVQYMEPRTTISILPYGLAGAQTVNKVGAETWDGPGLAIHWAEIEGPLYDQWPPESHRRLFGELARKPAPIYNFSDRVEVASDAPIADAQRLLQDFMRRAFRREVSNDDVAPFVAIVKSKQADGYTFEQAMRAAYKGILISPEFLFLREQPGKLDDFALASRLSYFLWSSMPDEELLSLAAKGELKRASTLREQVERMLKHPKAVALTENFVGQWLALREIDSTEPSHILYPEFDHFLKVSMIRETELFFEELLKDNLSIANLIASDFSMLNGRLGKHYGIEGLEGWEFCRTKLPPESHRGGVLTMASVLKVTANGTTTSPVLRGAWVLDRILGTPPSPPPDDVPVIEPDIRGASTIREQLAKHRSVVACASCHVTIDPPGFALESFDCIGGWRDNYRVTGSGATVIIDGRRMAYHRGKPVDPSDVLADGSRFQNVDEFKQLLLRDKDQLARAITTKLLTYATGSAPAAIDKPEIERIVGQVREHNYGLRSIVHEVVQSALFQTK